MARQEMFVDLAKLKLVIDQLEDEQIAKGAPAHRPFRSRGELCKAVVAHDWGQAIGLTPAVVSSRIDRYSIECRTGVRYRGVAVPVAPAEVTVASGAPVGVPGGDPVVAPGAEPDAVAPRYAPVASARRKSMYRGIDLDAFVAPFLERGLDVESLSSIMTSSLHSNNTNLKIQAAWHDLRERFSIPRVGDKSQEIESVLPLDQVRLPGEPVFGEPIPTENEPVFGEPLVDESDSKTIGDLLTDEESTVEEFPELYAPIPTGEELDRPVDEILADVESQEVYSQGPIGEELYKPGLAYPYEEDRRTEGVDLETGTTAWDRAQEENLDQVRASMDEINQEEASQELYNHESNEFYDPATDDRTLDHIQEDNISFDPEIPVSESQELEDYLITGGPPLDECLDEYPEVYPEREDPRDIEAARELDEWLAAGGESQADYQAPASENHSQDEYLPLDVEDSPAPVTYDAESHDSTMFEVEETNPDETR